MWCGPVCLSLGCASCTKLRCPSHPLRALACPQALQHFAPHIQQLSMESNGKGVALDGTRLPFETGVWCGSVLGVGGKQEGGTRMCRRAARLEAASASWWVGGKCECVVADLAGLVLSLRMRAGCQAGSLL